MPNTFVWGSVLVIVGLSLIFKTIFGFSLPIIRPFMGLLLLYAGFVMIVNPKSTPGRTPSNTIAFSTRTIRPTVAHDTYHTAFGSSIIDLTQLSYEGCETTLHINTAFGTTKLIIRKDIPTRVVLSTSFGYALMPDGSTHTLGHYEYNSSTQTPDLIIHINLAFANLEVETV